MGCGILAARSTSTLSVSRRQQKVLIKGQGCSYRTIQRRGVCEGAIRGTSNRSSPTAATSSCSTDPARAYSTCFLIGKISQVE